MSNNGGMTLTEFLEARIAEDESAARAASPGPWQWVGEPAEDSAFLYMENGDSVLSAYGMHTEGYIECSDADRAYITRNNPARVLAECAAKRAIVDLYRNGVMGEIFDGEKWTNPLAPLAAVYADHPDYRQEWRI